MSAIKSTISRLWSSKDNRSSYPCLRQALGLPKEPPVAAAPGTRQRQAEVEPASGGQPRLQRVVITVAVLFGTLLAG